MELKNKPAEPKYFYLYVYQILYIKKEAIIISGVYDLLFDQILFHQT